MFSHLAVASSLAIGDMLFYAICFIILMWLIKIVAWKPINKMMQDRADKISTILIQLSRGRCAACKATPRRNWLTHVMKRQLLLIQLRSEGNSAMVFLAEAQTDAQSLKDNAKRISSRSVKTYLLVCVTMKTYLLRLLPRSFKKN